MVSGCRDRRRTGGRGGERERGRDGQWRRGPPIYLESGDVAKEKDGRRVEVGDDWGSFVGGERAVKKNLLVACSNGSF
jgi:hypothetical protein